MYYQDRYPEERGNGSIYQEAVYSEIMMIMCHVIQVNIYIFLYKQFIRVLIK
jgi:hypothetical protein